MLRACARLAVVSVVAAATLQAVAVAPAAAHGLGGTDPSNYETELLEVTPPVEGISVKVIDLGDRLEVENTTDKEITVLGYEDEPYLRIGPDGVFENQRSPATWANRDRYAAVSAPPEVDAEAEPVWEKVSSGDAARFHWHLAHWMSPARPAIVDEDPDSEHLLGEWTLELVPNDPSAETIIASGELRWVPGPSPIPGLLVALVLGGVMVATSLTRYWRWVLAVSLAVLVFAELVHLVGLWSASNDSTPQRFLQNLYSLAGIAIACPALWRLATPSRDPYDATPLALIAGLVLSVAGGLADLSTLSSSQLATSLAPSVARGTLVATLGLGFGVVVASALKLKRPAAMEAAEG